MRTRTLGLLTLLFLISAVTAYGQNPHINPDRGAKVGNSYAVGDFETINTTNGNLMLKFPFGGLPAGRGSASSGMHLTYNSKQLRIRSERLPNPEKAGEYYNRTVLENDQFKGGWQFYSGYRLELEPRFPSPVPGCSGLSLPNDQDYQIMYSNKLKVIFPDGSTHELIPYGHKDYLGDRFFNVDLNGQIFDCDTGYSNTGRPVYYTRDGSYLRLETTSLNDWVLYFPDGSKVTSSTSPNEQRIYDRNGNFVTMSLYEVEDQFGRSIVKNGVSHPTLVTFKGVEDADIVWEIQWKTIAVSKTYVACHHHECPNVFPLPNLRDYLRTGITVVDKIIQPQQLGGGEYVFNYNAPTYEGSEHDWEELSDGWGEISSITLPSGATVNYEYLLDGEDGPIALIGTKGILKNHVTTKTLEYDLEYDGASPTPTSEVWTYEIGQSESAVTGPDGGVTNMYFGVTDVVETEIGTGYMPWNSGLALRTESPDGTIVENIWERNIPTDCHGSSTCAGGIFGEHADNPYIKTEFTSIKDATGNYVKTAIKDFTYDKNGNLTQVKEYDFVPYGDVPRAYGRPTGLPSGASSYLKRTTNTEYYNDTPTASSTDYSSGNMYFVTNSPRLFRLAKSVAVLDGSGIAQSRSDITYDHTNYFYANTIAGNPVLTRTWDSTKGVVTNPLTDGNSVKTEATYNSYGMPLTTTDAKGTVTQVTYGAISGPNGAVYDLYPTQTVAAYGTSLARTSAATYDFYTGAVLTTTDVDNGVTNATEYDDLGRPTKAITAQGTALESWMTTEYDDVNRRVVVRSDLETVGDGRKVATQFFDQLGRVRLAKTLEDPLTQSPYNETDGIKVQTRYKTVSGYTYQLSSNPYRAPTSSAETDPTMGWTLTTGWSHGRRSEVQTFSGSALPTVFGGGNTNSTGIVRTDIDAERTLVTDRAGKQRVSKTNALGQLKAVWEILPASETGSESITFPNTSIAHGFKTTYNYDTLSNLTTVNQGSQQRNFTYSSLSRLLTAANPESGTIQYGYDPNGNLTTKTDARSITTTYAYDALNRVTQRSYSDSTPAVSYFYDNLTNAKGRLTKVTSSVSTTEYTAFDILGRVTGHKQTTDGQEYATAYAYNLSGAMVEQTYPSGRVVKNVLDTNGDLSMVQSKKNAAAGYWNYAENFTYNAAGAVTSMQLGNGRWESTQFNSRLQPTQIALGTVQNGHDKLRLQYGYGDTDNNGNVVSQTITVPTVGTEQGFTATQNYAYDSLNRLKSAEETISSQTSWKQAFTFDRYGNRNFDEANTTFAGFEKLCNNNTELCAELRKILNPSVNTSNNRLSSSDDYVFDAAGNTTVDAQGRQFTYDAENKQIEVKNDKDETIGQYRYDGDGKRVKKYIPGTGEVTVFVYDASGKSIAEYSTVVESVENAKVAYLTNDHLGSPRVNTDRDGHVTSRRDFHPFGEEIASGTGGRTTAQGYGGQDSIRQKFTGYERDAETDLDFAQARMYGYNHGRFTSPDPENAGAFEQEPQSWNGYVYVGNNPLNITDPTGLIWLRNGSDLHWMDDDVYNQYKDTDEFKEKYGSFEVLQYGSVVTLAQGQTGQFAGLDGEQIRLGRNRQWEHVTSEALNVFADNDPIEPSQINRMAVGAENRTLWFWRPVIYAATPAVMLPAIPVMAGGSAAGGGILGLGLGGTGTAAATTGGSVGVIFTSHGAIHAAREGFSRVAAENAIRNVVQSIASRGGIVGEFWGKVTVGGTTIIYRAFPLADGTIRIGTYYDPSKR